MKTSRIFFSTLLFTLLIILIFIQCKKDDAFQVENSAINHIALSVDAIDFIETLESPNDEFTGLFVKVLEGHLLFEKIKIENNQFKSQEFEKQPFLTKIMITEEGEIQEISPNSTKQELEEVNQNFDLVYFNWNDLKMIANNSDKLYFSNAQIYFGATIHSTNNSANKTPFPTLKVEGDFGKEILLNEESKNLTTTFLIGAPCPPYWHNS